MKFRPLKKCWEASIMSCPDKGRKSGMEALHRSHAVKVEQVLFRMVGNEVLRIETGTEALWTKKIYSTKGRVKSD